MASTPIPLVPVSVNVHVDLPADVADKQRATIMAASINAILRERHHTAGAAVRYTGSSGVQVTFTIPADLSEEEVRGLEGRIGHAVEFIKTTVVAP
jgi:hypothetical protein